MLRRMCNSLTRVVDIAQEAFLEGHYPFFSLYEIKKKEAAKTVLQPFQARMEQRTKERYCQVLHRVMAYIFKTMTVEGRPKYRMNLRQRQAWNNFRSSAENLEEDELHGEGEVLGEDEEELAPDNDEDEVVPVQPTRELTPLREIDELCLEFWCALLDHRLEANHYDSGLLSALAAIGVDREEKTWQTPENYTPKLSAVVKLARMMVVLKALQTGNHGAVQRIQGMVRQFMVEEQPVPMSWIFSTRRYGLKIRYTTTASGRIHWDGDTIGYQNVKFSMGQFRAWVHGLVGECQSILEKDLLMINEDIGGGEELPQIPWSALGDNPSENRPGYHLVNHNESQLPVDGHSWLFHRIVGNPQRAQEFLSDGKEWRAARIKSYLRSLRRFKEKMLVLMHICGGQPARAPELLSIRYCNTHTGGRRNIFLEAGQVGFVTAYHKGYSFEGSSKIIHRYLPQEVGALLVYYLWLVRPFQEQIEVSHSRCRRLSEVLSTMLSIMPSDLGFFFFDFLTGGSAWGAITGDREFSSSPTALSSGRVSTPSSPSSASGISAGKESPVLTTSFSLP